MFRSSRAKSRQFVVWNIQIIVFIPISVPLFFCLVLCYQFCYWLLKLILLWFFKCNPRCSCIYAYMQSLMLVSPLPPSVLDTCSLSLSHLGCKALCIVISFLVLLSVCLSSSLIYFKNCPEYPISGTAQLFIPLMRFLLQSLVSRCFLVLLKYFFLFFFLSSLLVGRCSLPIFPSTCDFLSLRVF